MPTVPLPPWLRAWQQTWYWQILLMPALIGFGGSLVVNGCFANGLFAIGLPCVKLATSTWVLALLTSFIKGHSSGSASFNPNGTPNTTVNDVVTVQGAVDTHSVAAEAVPKIAVAAALAAGAVRNS